MHIRGKFYKLVIKKILPNLALLAYITKQQKYLPNHILTYSNFPFFTFNSHNHKKVKKIPVGAILTHIYDKLCKLVYITKQ